MNDFIVYLYYIINIHFNSVGLDAQIALQFHNMRESNPGLFKSRTLNKGIYGIYGMQKLIDTPPCVSDFGLSIGVNGKDIDGEILKKLQCVVWQNIPSYSGGAVLWKTVDPNDNLEMPCAMDDGILELVGLRNIKQLVGIQTSVQSGTKLGQGNIFNISVTTECPIQVDGEPMIIGPSDIEISPLNVAVMLSKLPHTV